MVDEYVLNYIKRHHKESSLEDLKKQIGLAGYSQKDFEQALKKLKSDKDFKSSFSEFVSGGSGAVSEKAVKTEQAGAVSKAKTSFDSKTSTIALETKEGASKSLKAVPRESDKTLLGKFFGSFSSKPKIPLQPSSGGSNKFPVKGKKVKGPAIVKPLTRSVSEKPSEPSVELFPVPVEHLHTNSLSGDSGKDSSISIVSSKVPSSVYRSNLRMAGVYSIFAVIFVILFFVLEYFFAGTAEYRPMPISIISLILVSVFLIFFYYGFVIMGRRYNKRFMEFAGWIFVLVVLCSFFILVLLLISPIKVSDFVSRYLISLSLDRLSFDLLFQGIFSSLLLWIFVGLNIIFGIGLITLRRGIKHTIISGILHIVGGILLLFGFGIVVLLIAFLFEIILFFRETRQE